MIDGKLAVAIHGAGKVAYAHAASWLKNRHARIVSVGSRTRTSAERLVTRLGLDCRVHERFEDVLASDQIDIVNLSGPNHVHARQGIAAAEAGKHLLVEKPMGITLDEIRGLRDAVAHAGVKSVVSFVLRWNPLVASLRSLLAARTIGDVFYAEIDYWHGVGPGHSAWSWASHPQTAGSAMLWGGCHAVDLLHFLVGRKVIEVSAFGNNMRRNFAYDSNVVALLRFQGGLLAKTSVLLDAAMPYTLNIDLVGTEGTIRENRLWAKRLLPGQSAWTTMAAAAPDSADVHCHPFDAQVDHLVRSILEDRPSHSDVADAYHSHEICLAIDRSVAADGIAIHLPLMERLTSKVKPDRRNPFCNG